MCQALLFFAPLGALGQGVQMRTFFGHFWPGIEGGVREGKMVAKSCYSEASGHSQVAEESLHRNYKAQDMYVDLNPEAVQVRTRFGQHASGSKRSNTAGTHVTALTFPGWAF
eukprot:1140344-Pelagomonas_calceolata.AAC.12